MTATLPIPASPIAEPKTIANLIEQLGGISPTRIWLTPQPGTATEQDVLDAKAHMGRLCELVDGVLVEKPMGYRESLIAIFLAGVLGAFVRDRNLGLVSGEAGMMRLLPSRIRMPDVAFVSWARVPGGRVPDAPIPELAPDLAIEVLSRSNTPAEMLKKREEYFRAGGQLVWQIDPDERTVEVFHTPENPTVLRGTDTLDGEGILPGFRLALAELFAVLDQHAPGSDR